MTQPISRGATDSMKKLNADSRKHFDELRERVRGEVQQGRFAAALTMCDEAIDWARDSGDSEALELAECNRAGIRIAQGKGDGAAGRLRRILLGSSCDGNRFLAAYNLSRFHELRRETERGLFYARQGLRYARRARRREFVAGSYHQVGNLQLLDCRFEEACRSYERALRLSPEAGVERAIMVSNVGYCQVVLERHREGFERLFESLRQMRRLGAEPWEMLPRLGLSYAYLEIHKPAPARRHAERALGLAETIDCREHVMNALYLLGEAEKLLGDELAAYERFHRLQRDFYPEQPFIAELLMSTDIRQLIHLMA